MALTSVETYTEKLLKRLQSLYSEYCNELQIIEARLDDSSVEVLETFINIEQHRFQQISSVEKVLGSHFLGCSALFQKNASEKLDILRPKALNMSRELRIHLDSRMTQIKAELSSIRFPGRVKNYRQESVPVLIDIET